jgi:ABC-type phosphate transport system substrate-binding protein
MKKAWLIALLLLALPIHAEIVVIANSKAGLTALTPAQVEDIFMGRTSTFPNGKAAQAVDHALLRPDFYRRLVNRPIEQIDAYWARIVFTGRNVPPPQLPGDGAVLAAVRKSETAIGYLDKSTVPKDVRVLLVLP